MDLIQTQVSLSNIGGKKSMSKILKSFGMAVLMAALLVGTGMAADMTLTGAVQGSVEVTVSPSSINWTLDVGDNTYTTVATNSTITSNTNATLSVKETASGDNLADGKMYSATKGAALGEELKLDGITTGATDIIALSEVDQTLYTHTTVGSQVVDFDYRQAIAYTDAAASDYGIIVTFTGAIV